MSESREEKGYTTPPGKDEREIPPPSFFSPDDLEALNRKGIKYTAWRGFAVPVGPGCSTEFYDEIARRQQGNEAMVVLVVGAPGSGKSYMALRLAEIFDPKFDVNRQMCFTRLQVYDIIGKKIRVERGQAVILDESHVSIGARTFQVEDQRDLVNLIAAMRREGFLFMVIALHENMIDVIVRSYTGAFMIGMDKPGRGVPYKLYTPRFATKAWRERMDPIEVALPQEELCGFGDCLICKFIDRCRIMRAVYERRKQEYLISLATRASDRIMGRAKKQLEPSDDEKAQWLIEDPSQIRLGARGGIDHTSIQEVMAKKGYPCGMTKARDLWYRALAKEPTLKEQVARANEQ